MYDAKEAGRDRVAVFNVATGRQERMRTRLTWADRIRSALERDAFVVGVQSVGVRPAAVPDRRAMWRRASR
jgi:hypothetical protein